MRLPINVFPCEDCRTRECLALKEVLPAMAPGDAWMAGRNFCTLDFTCGIAVKHAYFMTRE